MNLRRIHDISLKWKLLIPFLFLSFVGTTFLILLGLNGQKRLIESQEQKKLFDYYQAFSDQIEDRERSALSLAYQVAQSPAVQEAFARRDRRALIELLLPSYQVLKQEFDVKQFHFHTIPATSFLRLHRIYQYGEEMASFRHTIARVEESGQGIAGLEWGVTGFGVRGVVPVFYQDKLIGTFEVGYSVEQPFLESLKRRYNMNLVLLIPSEGDEGFNQLATTSAKTPLIPGGTYSKVFRAQSPAVLISPPGAAGLAFFLGPLTDFSGKSIGVVEISVDRAATLARLARNRNLMFAVMVGALVVSSVLIIWVVALFLRPVHGIVKVAREIAGGKRDQQIPVQVHDEIGTLADSLNDMLDSLNRARQEVQQYCDTLEERVKMRTHELAEEKEKYETLVEHAPIIVYRIEPDGTIVFVNQFVEEILGYTPIEVTGDRDFWTKTVHPEDRKKVTEQFTACLAEGGQFMMEYRGIHKSGLELFLLNHAIPLLDEEGRVQAVDGIIVDVSERKRLQEKIIQTEELKTLSNISARLAHEIRNPLTSAGGFARRLLKEMDPNDSHRRKVEIVVQEMGRLEQILKMILSYIRPISLEFAEVDLNDLLREAARGAEEKIDRLGIKLDLELDQRLPYIHADRSHLCNALETILKNACRHMPDESRLRVVTTYDGAAVVRLSYPALHLADDDMEHFFYPFVAEKLDEAALEMPLTKVVIHRHGGIINIERDEEDKIVISISFEPIERRGESIAGLEIQI
ncbi:MAG: cache domain-containing protein [Syntrophobacterales bacterium]|jgi:PAS domain S-box-containing protein